MNKEYIHSELTKRNIAHEFKWTDAGEIVQLIKCVYPVGGSTWNALLPIDDEQDEAFVDFVEHWRKNNPVMIATQRVSQ